MTASPKGNCFQRAAKAVCGEDPIPPLSLLISLSSNGSAVLVHGVPLGTGGEALGVRFAHAWVEYAGLCFDFSNGREIVASRDLYYRSGQIEMERCKRYALHEVFAHLVKYGHYGPWEELGAEA
jgi:hypothetical protein